MLIVEFIEGMGWLERVSVATGLIYIVLSVRQKPLCWPFGIVSTAAWMIVVFQGKLYMDSLLQLIYVVLGFYGWYGWLRGGADKAPLPVSRITRNQSAILLGIGVVAAVPLGLVSQFLLEADFPWWDTITTVMSVIATYLLARKVLENWILWIVADSMYIGIYYAKGWNGYMILMAVYTSMAFVGLWNWRRACASQLTD